ncbi:HNH endonuclease [Nitrosospira sp. Nsp2]|uniref:HNH endonuclease signature motif containing protein n=1 Tax=Nitrosospira sp. Nsp2 TaxID=136548 RepID=UPI000D3134D7|nr:HNH endonuclease signature motif containing protein [Nitrosospira sp. Nsp2]PTR17466.1 HNH endonuclease [Nitrosospira sp. Nsp2]
MRKRQLWTDVEKELLKQLYPSTPTDELARKLDRPLRSVYEQARLLNVHKSAEFRSRPEAVAPMGDKGAAYRFSPNHTPWNKGMKGLQLSRMDTRFKHGQLPHNTVPVGTELMSSDGYLRLKVGHPNEWIFVHRKNWEEAHGPIPKGMCVLFKDGNRENCAVENLQLLTRKELMLRNSVLQYPPELVEVIRMRQGFIKRLNHMEKKRNEKSE